MFSLKVETQVVEEVKGLPGKNEAHRFRPVLGLDPWSMYTITIYVGLGELQNRKNQAVEAKLKKFHFIFTINYDIAGGHVTGAMSQSSQKR